LAVFCSKTGIWWALAYGSLRIPPEDYPPEDAQLAYMAQLKRDLGRLAEEIERLWEERARSWH